MGAGTPERMERVFILCDKLHAVVDPRKNTFRPKVDMKDAKSFRKKKNVADNTDDSYEQRRVKEILSKYNK